VKKGAVLTNALAYYSKVKIVQNKSFLNSGLRWIFFYKSQPLELVLLKHQCCRKKGFIPPVPKNQQQSAPQKIDKKSRREQETRDSDSKEEKVI
jgi:hypothetical protein